MAWGSCGDRALPHRRSPHTVRPLTGPGALLPSAGLSPHTSMSRLSPFPTAARFALFCVALAACGDDPGSDTDTGPTRDIGADASDDVAVFDATDDVDRMDVGGDTTADATTDSDPTDTRTDADPADIGVDVADVGQDAPSDVRGDVIADTGADTADAADAADAVDTTPDVPVGPCSYATPVGAAEERVVLLGHIYTDDVEVPGQDVRLMLLGTDGELEDVGYRLDVGFRPQRIELMPSGEIALVLGEDGELASVEVRKDSLGLIDTVTLPSASYGDMRLAADDGLAFIVGFNSTATGGVSTVRVACDGTLSIAPDFMSLRLSNSMAFLPGDRALLLGGQAVFEPVDDDDIRLLERDGDGWREIASFDIWGDFTDALRIDATPDGRYGIMPNGSPFSEEGNQVLLVALNGDGVTEAQRITGMTDAREAHFSTDGQSAIVTLFEPGQLVGFRLSGGLLTETNRISGIGLVDQAAIVRRGPLTDRVLMASTDGSGISNVAMVQIGSDGTLEDLGQFDLGDGFDQIPGPIAVVP